ncbi:MAG: hypothetical protein K1Y36_01355 [Blastocatellia bacterium]|nr:hypothetical protein [Blastocatellia bacterium]
MFFHSRISFRSIGWLTFCLLGLGVCFGPVSSSAWNFSETPLPSHKPVFNPNVADMRCASLSDPTLFGPGTTGGVNPNARRTTSSDGRYIVFSSVSGSLVPNDTNGFEDIFLRDTMTGITRLVSVNSGGTGGGDGASFNPVISADGRFVAFESAATNLTADADGNFGSDVFWRDMQKPTCTLVSESFAGGSTGDVFSMNPDLSSNGRFIAFSSFSSNLVISDSNFSEDVFWRDMNPGGSPGAIGLVSSNSAGTDTGDLQSNRPVISGNGRYVAFESFASNLTLNDTNGFVSDVFRRDMNPGGSPAPTELVSAIPGLTGSGNNNSSSASIDDSGQYVAFVSDASDLDTGDGNSLSDAFWRDMGATQCRLVSRNSTNTASGNNISDTARISGNGQFVAFRSDASNLTTATDSNSASDIFRRDVVGNSTLLVSRRSGVNQTGNGASTEPSISSDGRYVAYTTEASNLVAGDTNLATDVLRRDTTVLGSVLVTVNAAVTASGNSSSSTPRLSADGSAVVFVSLAGDLVNFDTVGTNDVFIRSFATSTTQLLTVRIGSLFSATGNAGSSGIQLSSDGRYAVFQSDATDLTANDTNTFGDIFWRDLQTGRTVLVSVNSSGTGSGNGTSALPVLSRNGRYVAFFSSATNLVTTPTTGAGDIYLRDMNPGGSPGAVQLVSINDAGTSGGNNASYNPVVSDDGRYVAFVSNAFDLIPIAQDLNSGVSDVFWRDMLAASCRVVSLRSDLTGAANNASDSPVLSFDGRYVVFASMGSDIAAGDANGQSDVFWRDMNPGGPALPAQLVSANTSGTASGDGAAMLPKASSNGRYVAFESFASDLVATDPNGSGSDVFWRDMNPGGTPGAIRLASGGNGFSSAAAISDDGRYVSFQSDATDLDPTDTNFNSDIYWRDINPAGALGPVLLVSVNAGGTNGGDSGSNTPMLSSNGRYVAFTSNASDLVASDSNFSQDIFWRDMNPGGAPGTIQLASINLPGTDSGNQLSTSFNLSADGRFVGFESTASNFIASDLNTVSDVFVMAMCTVNASVTTNSPVFINQALTLTATGPIGATYNWTAPNGDNFTGATVNVMGTLAYSGKWRVVVTAGSCSISVITNVLVDVSANAGLTVGINGYEALPSIGYVGNYSINTTLTNTGSSTFYGPMFFRVETLAKVGTDLAPGQPYTLLTADNQAGLPGDVQTLPLGTLGGGQTYPVTFTVGIAGARQPFRIDVALYAATNNSPRPDFVGRYQFVVNQNQFSNPKGAVLDGRDGTVVPNAPFDRESLMIGGNGAQSSPVAISNPKNPLQMAVACTDYASRSISIRTTNDGGNSWQTTTLPATVQGVSYYSAQSPSLSYSGSGELFVAYTVANLTDSANAVVVARSTNGLSFGTTVLSSYGATQVVYESRPTVAVAGDGRVFVVWESLNPLKNTSSIIVARAFGPDLPRTTLRQGFVSHPTLAITPGGTVLAGWNEWDGKNQSTGQVLVASSSNGLTYGTPIPLGATGLGLGVKLPSMPEKAVGANLSLVPDPNKEGIVYAAFTGVGKNLDVFFTSTSDGGKSWSAPRIVNDDTVLADQFHPTLAVDGRSTVYLSFYDTRQNPSRQTVDVYVTSSVDGGKSFSRNERVTTVPSNTSKSNPKRDFSANLGSRIGLTTLDRNLLLVWTDTRSGSEDVYSLVRAGSITKE